MKSLLKPSRVHAYRFFGSIALAFALLINQIMPFAVIGTRAYANEEPTEQSAPVQEPVQVEEQAPEKTPAEPEQEAVPEETDITPEEEPTEGQLPVEEQTPEEQVPPEVPAPTEAVPTEMPVTEEPTVAPTVAPVEPTPTQVVEPTEVPVKNEEEVIEEQPVETPETTNTKQKENAPAPELAADELIETNQEPEQTMDANISIPGQIGWSTQIPDGSYDGTGGLANYVGCGETLTDNSQRYGAVWGVAQSTDDIVRYEREFFYLDEQGNPARYWSGTSANHYTGLVFTPGSGGINGGDGTYYMRVRAIDSAGDASISDTDWANKDYLNWCRLTIDTDGSENTELPAPVLGGGNTTYTCGESTTERYNTIDWTDVDVPAGATLIGYFYEVVQDPINGYGSGNGYTRFVPAGSATEVTGNFNKGFGQYIIRVQAIYEVDGVEQRSEWSNECPIFYGEFPAELPAPTNISFVTPEGEALACGATTDSEQITVLWNEVPEAVEYIYSVEYSETGEDGTWSAPWTTTTTVARYDGAFTPNGEGYRRIRIKAVDADGNESEWSTYCMIEYRLTDTYDVTIQGRKYADTNRNGTHDLNGFGDTSGEMMLGGWAITLYDEGGTAIATDVTSADGYGSNNGLYSFSEELEAGTYYVCEQGQQGWTQNAPAPGSTNTDQVSWGGSAQGEALAVGNPFTVGAPSCWQIDVNQTNTNINNVKFGNVEMTQNTVEITVQDPAVCVENMQGTATGDLEIATVVATFTNTADATDTFTRTAVIENPGNTDVTFTIDVSDIVGAYSVELIATDIDGNTATTTTTIDRRDCEEEEEEEEEVEEEVQEETWVTLDLQDPEVCAEYIFGTVNTSEGLAGIESVIATATNVNNPQEISTFPINNINNDGGFTIYAGAVTGVYELSITVTDQYGNTATDTVVVDRSNCEEDSSTEPNEDSSGIEEVKSDRCEDEAPNAAPELFQIDMTNTTATLYINPHGNPFNRVYISYWREGQPENEYGVEFEVNDYQGGVLVFQISDLDPHTTYNFKARLGNGCAPGPWGNTMKATTLGGTADSADEEGEVLGYTTGPDYLADTGKTMVHSLFVGSLLLFALIMLNFNRIMYYLRKYSRSYKNATPIMI